MAEKPPSVYPCPVSSFLLFSIPVPPGKNKFMVFERKGYVIDFRMLYNVGRANE